MGQAPPPPDAPGGPPARWGTGASTVGGIAGAWHRFRGWPTWLQVVLWVILWPVIGAVALLARPQKAVWHLVAAVVLLVAAAPAWAMALIAPSISGESTAVAGDQESAATDAPAPSDGTSAPVEEVTEPEGSDPGEPSAAEARPTADDAGEEPGEDAEPAGPAEPADPADPAPAAVAGDLEVHFLDVGQADATLLLHDDVAVLIDTGHWQRSEVVPYLRSQGVERLDLVVVTHPHADHIGQFDQVVDAFEVDEVWWSGSETTTQTFSRAVDALERSGARYEEPRTGDATSIGPLRFDVMNPPAGVGLRDLHDANLGFTVTYGEVTLLFTGDAESATEQRMVSTAGDGLRADILQVGHHGSNTSTTPAFLAAVDPAIAIYSAGTGNPYGHPHAEVLDRLSAADVDTYGTDVHGHVVVVTDGAGWSVSTQRSGTVTAAPSPGGDQTRAPPQTDAEDPPSEEPPPSPPASSGCAAGQVDINSAGVDALQDIIHIGPARAEDIIAMRPFASVDALTRISGIADARIADIKREGIACVG
jgi:competence protein ComEC